MIGNVTLAVLAFFAGAAIWARLYARKCRIPACIHGEGWDVYLDHQLLHEIPTQTHLQPHGCNYVRAGRTLTFNCAVDCVLQVNIFRCGSLIQRHVHVFAQSTRKTVTYVVPDPLEEEFVKVLES